MTTSALLAMATAPLSSKLHVSDLHLLMGHPTSILQRVVMRLPPGISVEMCLADLGLTKLPAVCCAPCHRHGAPGSLGQRVLHRGRRQHAEKRTIGRQSAAGRWLDDEGEGDVGGRGVCIKISADPPLLFLLQQSPTHTSAARVAGDQSGGAVHVARRQKAEALDDVFLHACLALSGLDDTTTVASVCDALLASSIFTADDMESLQQSAKLPGSIDSVSVSPGAHPGPRQPCASPALHRPLCDARGPLLQRRG